MINGLDNSYAQLTGLQNVYVDNITSNTYEYTTIGNYLSGITSNIQNQINNLSEVDLPTTTATSLQTQITELTTKEENDIATVNTSITSLNTSLNTLSSTITTNYNTEQSDKAALQSQINYFIINYNH